MCYNKIIKEGIFMSKNESTMTIRLSSKDKKIIKEFADFYNVSSSQFIRDAVMEKIEDSYDLAAYETAMKEFEEDKTTYSFDEAMEELGIEI